MRRCFVIFTFYLCVVCYGLQAEQPFVAGLTRLAQPSEKIHGSILLGELGCVACHATSNEALSAKSGPDLSGIGTRAASGHLLRFIAEPAASKPGTTMPDVLGHLPPKDRAEVAEALTHYLLSLSDQRPVFSPPKAEAVERGRKLYHSIGCVACHSPEQALVDSVPLGVLEEKYSTESLTKFLEDPLAVRPSGRMPDMKLGHFEAENIASYLLRKQSLLKADLKVDAKLAAKGQQLFTKHRCNACHSLGKTDRSVAGLPSLSKLRTDHGCLSSEVGAWPKYPLSVNQRDALRAAISAQAEQFSDADHITMTLAKLNCFACHQRGQTGGVSTQRNTYFTGRDENMGEQGRLPPTLTGVGAKLKSVWLRDVVVNGAAARPYLDTRMPKFGAGNTESLAVLFKRADELPVALFTRVNEAQKPHDIGRELAGSKGFNCLACHTFRGRSAAAIRAIDLMSMAERLEENWFHHYLSNPQQFSPLTIMPSFWADGKSPLTDVLAGDQGRQQDALWQFLAQGPDAREPLGLVLEPLVVSVKDEAVILRRAYPGIGKRGIGVGYPAQINLSFDAENMRLGSIWTGGFIEASALWRGQGSGQARILGKDIVNFPAGPAFALLQSAEVKWPDNVGQSPAGVSFKGYLLDAKRRPTFQYQIGEVLVEDYFQDQPSAGKKPFFIRSLNLKADTMPKALYFRVGVDRQIRRTAAREYVIGDKLVVRMGEDGFIRDQGELKELLLPVSGPFKIEYHFPE